MAPQFVRDYVKHVGLTHWRCEKKKELEEEQQSFSPSDLALQVHFSSLSLYVMLWLKKTNKKTTTQNRLVFGQNGITFSGTLWIKLHFFTTIFVLGLICGIKGCMRMKAEHKTDSHNYSSESLKLE